MVRRLDLATVGEGAGDSSTVDVGLRRVFIVGAVCGVPGRLE